MGEHVTVTQITMAGTIAAIGTMWGKVGWLIVLWAIAMGIDYLTGTLAAIHNHEWDSNRAREGIWHKAGMLVVVLVAAMFDLAVKQIAAASGIILPFDVLALPIVLSWYTITELGSILENAIKMGAENVPEWLKKGLKVAADTIDNTGNAAVGGKGKEDKDDA